MEENINKKTFKKKFSDFYDRSYKIIMILPILMILLSVFYLFQFYSIHGDIVYKDVSITGGTSITVFDENYSPEEVKKGLESKFPDLKTRAISDLRTGKQQAFFVETKSDSEEIKASLEEFLGYELDQDNSSIEFTGSVISSGFYRQLQAAVVISFLLMAIVVFIIFRTAIPSLAVIIAAFADIIFTIVVINLAEISLSIGGVVALLMLIGYSVDTDILLTTRLIRKKEGSVNERMFGAFKTGMTMTLTSLVAIAVALAVIYNFSETLKQIFTILLIGLGFDIFNTWITNASILKWYTEVKQIK